MSRYTKMLPVVAVIVPLYVIVMRPIRATDHGLLAYSQVRPAPSPPLLPKYGRTAT
jgi:hypothetical protein